MFALVKFIVDSEKEQVPVSFIQNFDFDSEAEQIPGLVKPVFWSPTEGETPRDVLSAQGIILHPEKEVDSKRKNGRTEAVPGYYDAEILSIANSENELDTKISIKRIRSSTDKARNLKTGQIKNKKTTLSKSITDKAAKKSGLRNNLNKLLNVKLASSESDDDMITVQEAKKTFKKKEEETQKIHNAEIKKLSDDLSSLKKKNKKLLREKEELASEVKTLKAINMKYQMKFLDFEKSPKRKNGSPCHFSISPKLKKKETSYCKSPKEVSPKRNISPLKDSPNHDEINSPLYHCKSDFSFLSNISTSKNHTPVKDNVTENKKVVKARRLSYSENSSPAKKEASSRTLSPAKALIKPVPSDDAKGKFHLSAEDLNKCSFGVPSGQAGDSKFVKNAAVKIFSETVLKNSSISGRRCPTKPKDASCKPRLDEKKLAYLEDLLLTRIKNEFNGKPPDHILSQRGTNSKMTHYVREHMGWLNRK